jgi:hypothetical protein
MVSNYEPISFSEPFVFLDVFVFCKIKQFKRSSEPLLLKGDGDDYKQGLKWW